jgi:hypothetical protein
MVRWSKNTTCCQRATDEEIRDAPDHYDCTRCELAGRIGGLWRENADAWKMYGVLRGGAVQGLQLDNWLIDRWTADWPVERVLDLVRRFEIIHDELDPDGHTPD